MKSKLCLSVLALLAVISAAAMAQSPVIDQANDPAETAPASLGANPDSDGEVAPIDAGLIPCEVDGTIECFDQQENTAVCAGQCYCDYGSFNSGPTDCATPCFFPGVLKQITAGTMCDDVVSLAKTPGHCAPGCIETGTTTAGPFDLTDILGRACCLVTIRRTCAPQCDFEDPSAM